MWNNIELRSGKSGTSNERSRIPINGGGAEEV